jgi:CheY-like chemotaxis protein
MARVLVVDDDPDLLMLVEMQLRRNKHKVATAASGREALDMVESKGCPDVAILDVAMPGMNGLELLRELRSKPGMESMPAVFLSARVGPEDIKAGQALGARYLTKPYVMNALLAAIEDSLTEQEEEATAW